MNALAKVGKPALAMLVSSEERNMDNERLTNAQLTEGVRAVFPFTLSRFAMIVLKRISSLLTTLEIELLKK